MKQFIIGFCVSLISITAQADFSGQWRGTGQLIDDKGKVFTCSSLSVDIAQTATLLPLRFGAPVCSGGTGKAGTIKFKIKNGKLLYSGTVVGTITATEFHAAILSGTSQYRFISHYDGALVNGQFQLVSDTYSFPGGARLFELDGLYNR
jgi:hypothetical protein